MPSPAGGRGHGDGLPRTERLCATSVIASFTARNGRSTTSALFPLMPNPAIIRAGPTALNDT